MPSRTPTLLVVILLLISGMAISAHAQDLGDPFPEGAFDASNPQLTWKQFDLIVVGQPVSKLRTIVANANIWKRYTDSLDGLIARELEFGNLDVLHGTCPKTIRVQYLVHTDSFDGLHGFIDPRFRKANVKLQIDGRYYLQESDRFLLRLSSSPTTPGVFLLDTRRIDGANSANLLVRP